MISKIQFEQIKEKLEKELTKKGYPTKMIYDKGHLYIFINISKIKKELKSVLVSNNLRDAKIYIQDDWTIIIKV